MYRDFVKINESNDAVKFTYESPEEYQRDCRVFPSEIPQGQVLTIRHGVNVRKQPWIMVGLAKVGEPMSVEADAAGQPKPSSNQQTAPASLEIPHVLRKRENEGDEQYDARIEKLAARNGITVTPAWRGRTRQLRLADVAGAVAKQNAA